MKYYAMWHPIVKWGAPTPILIRHKRDVATTTGVSLVRMREMGYRWIGVDVDEPEVETTEAELMRVTEEISELQARQSELYFKLEGERAEGTEATDGQQEPGSSEH